MIIKCRKRLTNYCFESNYFMSRMNERNEGQTNFFIYYKGNYSTCFKHYSAFTLQFGYGSFLFTRKIENSSLF